MSDTKIASQAHEGSDEKHLGHEHHHHEVEVKINGKHYKVHVGNVSVRHLKHIAEIPHADVLEREIEGKFHHLDQDGEVRIHGGEEFLSRPHEITIWIDKQKFDLKIHEMTVAQLLELAGDNPKETTLAFKHGNELKKYTNIGEVICLVNGMRFVVFHNEPTPVS